MADEKCPRGELHTKPGPCGYVAWDTWAERKGRTHTQRKCPGCGLYAIWVPKTPVSVQMLLVMGYIANRQNVQTGVQTLGQAGGRTSTLLALERRGLIELPSDGESVFFPEPYRITTRGRKVLKEHKDDGTSKSPRAM